MEEGDGWIEVNLPWCRHVQLERPEYPNELVDKLVREQFGQTIEEFEKAFEEKHGESISVMLEKFRSKADREVNIGKDKRAIDFTEEDFILYEEELEKRLSELDDPVMEEIRTINLMRETIREFEETIPEVIAWKLEWDEVSRKEKDEEKRVSFHASELRRPGVLIEVRENGGDTRRFLLGDINCLSGVCDDCVAFDSDAIVVRAKVLVEASQLASS
jgi:hypothetical protein